MIGCTHLAPTDADAAAATVVHRDAAAVCSGGDEGCWMLNGAGQRCGLSGMPASCCNKKTSVCDATMALRAASSSAMAQLAFSLFSSSA